MHKRITFREMDHSDVLEQYANQQLKKIEDFLANEREPIFIDLILEAGKLHAHHHIELRIKTPQFDRISNYEGSNFNDVLDRVIDVMYRTLCEEKRKNIRLRKKTDWFKGT